jgi:uncharacterized protein (DUF736 family)
MIIGKFTPQNDGYVGLIATFGLREEARIEPTKPGSAGPDYVVLSDDGFVELGAAWKRHSSKTGKAYLSVKLDTPFVNAPINCALIEHEDGDHALVWSRKTRAEAPATA